MIDDIDEELFSIQVDRNLAGIQLEKEKKVDEAIILYEQNINEGFIGTHPYNRLVIIYSKKKQKADEIRVLQKAIQTFSKNVVNPNLATEKYRTRLEKVLKKN